jgi:ketosteroid isomerase-like protein
VITIGSGSHLGAARHRFAGDPFRNRCFAWKAALPSRDTAWAMSKENVELIRRGHEALQDAGEQAIFEYLDPDIDLTPVAETPGVETYHGHDGVRRYFETTREAFGEFRWEPQEYVDLGDHVLVPTRFVAEGRGSGVPVEAMIYNVFTVRGGKVVRVRGSISRDHALEAAGLRE